ncbi:hypothetical protein [Aquimarina brevivitae]|uniref:Uncharacterized protein n=1 Tax=Aquimarina brevivitae TaxID=323412 RepID=A0A4Q7NU48_9FLAO|nr:hypothetical protein [Aquimarina brevivitae]RZS90625.1 hypothetical protein EV197_3154 [Aquimarina brevivitae]
MKILPIILSLLTAQCIIGQEELIDAIETINNQKDVESGKVLCTEAYWTAEKDGGQRSFKQFAKMPAELELKLVDKNVKENRAVLTVDLIFNNEAVGKIYLYTIKNDDQWLLDGINESKHMIAYFMESKCSGHFDPTMIAANADLQQIGETMLTHITDTDALTTYMQEVFTEDSDFDSVVEQLTDTSYDKTVVTSAGYDEDFGKGYVFFTQYKEGQSYDSTITLYVSRTGMGTCKVYDYNFASPSANSFLR